MAALPKETVGKAIVGASEVLVRAARLPDNEGKVALFDIDEKKIAFVPIEHAAILLKDDSLRTKVRSSPRDEAKGNSNVIPMLAFWVVIVSRNYDAALTLVDAVQAVKGGKA